MNDNTFSRFLQRQVKGFRSLWKRSRIFCTRLPILAATFTLSILCLPGFSQAPQQGELITLDTPIDLTSEPLLEYADPTVDPALHASVQYDRYFVPGETVALDVPESAAPDSLGDLQAGLIAREPAEANLPQLPPLRQPFNPLADRIEKAGTLLITAGHGVFFNINDREMAIANLTANLKDPVGRVKYGWSYDSDSFRTNYVIHPVLWFSYATYLKGKGASDKEALIVTQVANLLWEGVMEGAYVPPSGIDLVTDLVSSIAGIYLFNKGPGKVMAEKVIKAEEWFAKKGFRIRPTFSGNPFNFGGRAGSELVIMLR